ncbi:MAG: 7-carboxy-7-deazaguanine synthase QueE [Candidatus Omnitrophota bacterium]
MLKGKISEIFYSVQGEGKFVGVPQAFVRFYGCNIKCRFCDTVLTNHFELTKEEVVKKVINMQPFHSVAITGGEPLIQFEFLKRLLLGFKKNGFCCYLETNGLLYNKLADVLPWVDIIAMDIKLPYTAKAGRFWTEHKNFLQIAKKKDVFVKIVIDKNTKKGELIEAVKLVANVDKKMTVILQPESRSFSRELFRSVYRFQKILLEYLKDVRVIPQMHKLVSIR